MRPFGGSPRTETSQSAISTVGTTVRASRNELVTSLSDLAPRSSSEAQQVTPRLSGDTQSIGGTTKLESSVRFSEMKERGSRRSLSDRLTLSLISAGLVCGISPSLTRKQSGQPILVLALDTPDGGDAARRNEGSSYLSEHRQNEGNSP